MKASFSLALAVQMLAVLAAPSQNKGTATTSAAAAATTTAPATVGEGEAGKENEVNLTGAFGQVIDLGGGDVKTDTLFPPGLNGAFEVEFQNQQARQLRVTENKTPAAAPAGFSALEPVSYIVEVAGGTANLTLQKIDYILTAGNTLDISQGRVGKLCTDTKTFILEGVGELEFEADENELTLTVDNLVGEWSIFVPNAAANAGAGAGAGADTGAGAGAGKDAGEGAGKGAGKAAGGAANQDIQNLLDQLLKLVGNTA